MFGCQYFFVSFLHKTGVSILKFLLCSWPPPRVICRTAQKKLHLTSTCKCRQKCSNLIFSKNILNKCYLQIYLSWRQPQWQGVEVEVFFAVWPQFGQKRQQRRSFYVEIAMPHKSSHFRLKSSNSKGMSAEWYFSVRVSC